MMDAQFQQVLEEKIRAEIEMMLCRVRLLEIDARQIQANAAARRAAGEFRQRWDRDDW